MFGFSRLSALLGGVAFILGSVPALAQGIRCGAAIVDVSPQNFPVIQNGGFLEAILKRQEDPLHARALVFDDGNEKLAIVVVDSCMIPRGLCDQAKTAANEKTGIATNRILISATHTHSAPSVMDNCLGSRKDPAYAAFLPGKIADAIELAHSKLQPAKVGYAVADADEYTKNRRWIRRSDKLDVDPFGERTVQAMMHPGHQNPDFIGPSGPTDPWLSLLSVQTTDGKPLALLANFSMHYFGGHPGASADYYGRFANEMKKRLAPDDDGYVAFMSQGTSGDLWWGDYSLPERRKWSIDEYTSGLANLAEVALQGIEYKSEIDLAMNQEMLTLYRRLPDEEQLAWARKKITEMGDNRPRNRPEVYAEQALWIEKNQIEGLVLQTLRIGDVAITAIPNEVYAITGLKLKARSRFPNTFNISLANGAAGYIPPPEQHLLGGYTTWPARTAGLEVQAEPKILSVLLKQLAKLDAPEGDYRGERLVREQEDPLFEGPDVVRYYSMAEFDEQSVYTYRSAPRKVAFAVPGVPSPKRKQSRAMHFAGGNLGNFDAHFPDETAGAPDFSVELWFKSGLPNDARDITGYLFSLDHFSLGITGRKATMPGRLFVGNALGRTEIAPKTWNHVVFSSKHDGNVEVYLNGSPDPELSFPTPKTFEMVSDRLPLSLAYKFADPSYPNFEGIIDEVYTYKRALTSDKAAEHYKAYDFEAPKSAGSKVSTESQPLSPEDTIAATHVPGGYVLELVAAEPEVLDPVAIDWGPDGKLWVAEMADYPYGMDGEGKPGGRVRYLEDTDGDGRYEKSTLFVDGLKFPTSVMAWRDGVLITAAPDILFASDSDRNGITEVRVLFTGFVQGNQQLRVNSLRWGLDNWFYCASGGHHVGFGKDTVITNAAGQTFELGSRDFRFNPDTGVLDPQSGPSQFGRVRDDWGNWFGVQNSWPLWHYVLPDQYLRRNTKFAAPDPRVQVRTPSNPRVFANKPVQKRFHSYEQSGRYTSACGPSIYRDELLFADNNNSFTAFTCEPFHNVVQRHIVERDGVSFKGDRANDGDRDIFASGDRWCRPVMSRTGPDGALYVVDMYRYMIEHPDWLPDNGKEELKPFYRSGEDRGRLYRIRKKDAPLRQVPALANGSAAQWIESLGHPNGIIRDQAHRLLFELHPKDDEVKSVQEMAERHANAKARLQALCLLDGWNKLPPNMLSQAARDASPEIRRHTARLAESRAHRDKSIAKIFSPLVEDTDASVRLQTILSLGQLPGQLHGENLAGLLANAAKSPTNKGEFFYAAILSSAPGHCATLAEATADLPTPLLKPLFSLALAKRNDTAAMLSAIDPDTVRGIEVAAAYYAALDEQPKPFRYPSSTSLEAMQRLEKAEKKLPAVIETARRFAADPSSPASVRTNALTLLGRKQLERERDISLLEKFITSPDDSLQFRKEALNRIGSMEDAATPLFTRWADLDGSLRDSVVEIALRRKSLTAAFLTQIQTGQIAAVTVARPYRQRFLSHDDKEIQEVAKKLFGSTGGTDRSKIAASLTAKLGKLNGDPDQGAATFKERCTVCHSVEDDAPRLGPDLRSITDRSTDGLLAAIVDPSRTVDPSYVGVTITLKTGEVLYGLVRSETGASYTLQLLDGTTKGIPRENIENVAPAPASLMPEGLEAGLTPQQLADLLAYIASLAKSNPTQ
jgi:putative membrane-bound dehydrogenase-like protein